MQVFNTFVLLLSAVLILAAGIIAKGISKERSFRAVVGILAPMLILSAVYVLVEMIVAGYKESQGSTVHATANQYFPRYAFTFLIITFVLVTAGSLVALKFRDKFNSTLAFLCGVATVLVASSALATVTVSEKYVTEHSPIILPVTVIFAFYGIFALANTLLGRENKLRKALIYVVDIISSVVAAFLIWFLYQGFSEEMKIAQKFNIGATVFAVFIAVVIAGPILLGFISLIGAEISGFMSKNRAKTDTKDKTEAEA